MNVAEIKAELTAIDRELIASEAGESHWASVVEQFNCRFPDARHDVGAEMYDSWLAEQARKIIHGNDRRGNSQMTLPGIGIECDSTVTVPDGEGSYIRRRLDKATAADLLADESIHETNVDAAIAARNRARQRNQVLLPVMEDHGFVTAGEAIEYLSGVA